MKHTASSGIVELDIHGMTKYKAKVTIDSKIKSAAADIYTIRVIHGCHGGTELRDMVRTEYKSHAKVKRLQHGVNPGITDLILRELF